MSDKQRLIDKINEELKTEKNPIAISVLKNMKAKWEKSKPSLQIVELFDTIRSKRTPEQQEAVEKEIEDATKAALEDDLRKNGPGYAKVLPEKLNIDLMWDRVGSVRQKDAHALTDQMDALVFGGKEKVTSQQEETPAIIDQPEDQDKLSVSGDYPNDIKQRMADAAQKAGLNPYNYEVPLNAKVEAKRFITEDDLTAGGPDEEMQPETKKIAPDLLEEGAEVYRQRNKVYGDSYKKQGEILNILFPDGLVIKGVKDFNRITILTTIVSKILRYSNDFSNPHDDSILDNMVYNAMLLELDRGE